MLAGWKADANKGQTPFSNSWCDDTLRGLAEVLQGFALIPASAHSNETYYRTLIVTSKNSCAHLSIVYPSEIRNGCGRFMILSQDLSDYRCHEIPEAIYVRFRDDDQPPAAFGFKWGGKSWDFGCRGAYGFIYAFAKRGSRFYAQKTELLAPDEVGMSLESQLASPEAMRAEVTKRLESMAHSWLSSWRALARKLPQLRHLGPRLLANSSLKVAASDNELMQILHGGSRGIGDSVARENLCFICVSNDNQEWAVLKDAMSLGVCSFREEASGVDTTSAKLDQLRMGTDGNWERTA